MSHGSSGLVPVTVIGATLWSDSSTISMSIVCCPPIGSGVASWSRLTAVSDPQVPNPVPYSGTTAVNGSDPG